MKVEWSKPDDDDLYNIKEYITSDSSYYARQFVNKILSATKKLQEFPMIGRVVPDQDDENIRELIFQSYRIIYRIKKKCIQILAIIHGSRDLSSKEVKTWNIL